MKSMIVAMEKWNQQIRATSTDRMGLRRLAVENACRCGQRECDQCQGDMERVLFEVFLWYLKQGGEENEGVSMKLHSEKCRNVTQFMVVATELCRMHSRRLGKKEEDARGNRPIVNALELLFNTTSNSEPTAKVSQCGLIRMATFTFGRFSRDERVSPKTLCNLLNWIRTFLNQKELNWEFNWCFLASVHDTLILNCIYLAGEILYCLPHLDAFNQGYMHVIKGVLAIGSTIADIIFVRYPPVATRNKGLLRKGQYRLHANMFGKKLVKLLELLRLHKVLNIGRAYNAAPPEWPVPRQNQFMKKISEIAEKLKEKNDDPYSLAMEAEKIKNRCFRVLNSEEFPRHSAEIGRRILKCVRYEFSSVNSAAPPETVADAVALANRRRYRGFFRADRARRLFTFAGGCGTL